MEYLGNCNACENARCALKYEDEEQKEDRLIRRQKMNHKEILEQFRTWYYSGYDEKYFPEYEMIEAALIALRNV